VRLDIPGTTPVPGLSLVVTASLGRGLVRAHEAGPGQLPAKASLNAVVWGQRTLWIRSWQPGDRMIPFGMTGSRKIQDILVDAKVPRAERSRIPVVECEGEIIWIPGYRIAASWAVTRPDSLNLQMNVERV
jgi:tRNA(Ile)-lysidine synthase